MRLDVITQTFYKTPKILRSGLIALSCAAAASMVFPSQNENSPLSPDALALNDATAAYAAHIEEAQKKVKNTSSPAVCAELHSDLEALDTENIHLSKQREAVDFKARLPHIFGMFSISHRRAELGQAVSEGCHPLSKELAP